MQKKFLEVKLHSFTKAAPNSEVISIYRVDLYTLAIGPVHHSIELVNKVTIYISHF